MNIAADTDIDTAAHTIGFTHPLAATSPTATAAASSTPPSASGSSNGGVSSAEGASGEGDGVTGVVITDAHQLEETAMSSPSTPSAPSSSSSSSVQEGEAVAESENAEVEQEGSVVVDAAGDPWSEYPAAAEAVARMRAFILSPQRDSSSSDEEGSQEEARVAIVADSDAGEQADEPVVAATAVETEAEEEEEETATSPVLAAVSPLSSARGASTEGVLSDVESAEVDAMAGLQASLDEV